MSFDWPEFDTAAFEEAGKETIEDLKQVGESLFAKLKGEDLQVATRTFTRLAVEYGKLLTDKANAETHKAQISFLLGTIQFMETRYAIVLAREVRKFFDRLMERVQAAAMKFLGAALVAL